MFPAFKPHEIPKLPKHYYQVLRDYYFMVHPPQERGEEDDFSTIGDREVDFDKISARRRHLMRTDWNEDVKKGDFV